MQSFLESCAFKAEIVTVFKHGTLVFPPSLLYTKTWIVFGSCAAVCLTGAPITRLKVPNLGPLRVVLCPDLVVMVWEGMLVAFVTVWGGVFVVFSGFCSKGWKGTRNVLIEKEEVIKRLWEMKNLTYAFTVDNEY